MGGRVSVQNDSDYGVTVTVWTVGKGFRVSSFGVNAHCEGNVKIGAVWYDVEVTEGSRTETLRIYGGNSGGVNLRWNNGISYR